MKSHAISGTLKAHFEAEVEDDSPASLTTLYGARTHFSQKPRSQLSTAHTSQDVLDETEELSDPIPPANRLTAPQVAYSSGSRRLSLASLSSRKKKRKLVISGIAPNDARRFDGVKRWCEVCTVAICSLEMSQTHSLELWRSKPDYSHAKRRPSCQLSPRGCGGNGKLLVSFLHSVPEFRYYRCVE